MYHALLFYKHKHYISMNQKIKINGQREPGCDCMELFIKELCNKLQYKGYT